MTRVSFAARQEDIRQLSGWGEWGVGGGGGEGVVRGSQAKIGTCDCDLSSNWTALTGDRDEFDWEINKYGTSILGCCGCLISVMDVKLSQVQHK